MRIDVAPAGSRYVFNASGQEIDLEGLLCVFDAEGPCANAVKDAQRTKTHAGTTRTLSVLWGSRALPGRAAGAAAWYKELLTGIGAATSDAPIGDGQAPSAVRVDGTDVGLEQAVSTAATRLCTAARPLVYLAPGLSCESQRAAVAIADLLRARLDSVSAQQIPQLR